MGFFKYPYTDLNELNLDWVIAKIKYIEQAKNIIYDNSGTPLISNNVQDVIDEIYTMISSQGVASFNGRAGVVVPETGDYTAAQVIYNNTGSGLTATDSQSAIDEIAARPLGGVESFNTRTGAVVPALGDYSAADVTYDNSGSGLTATETQSAIDEINNKIPATIVESFNTRTGAITPAAGDYDAGDITYDNTTSGLTATNTQGAIDELDNRLDNFSVNASQVSYDNTQSGLTANDAQAAIDEIANDVLSSGVASFNGRTGAVNPTSGDYNISMMGDYAGTPSDGDVLTYDGNASTWVPGAGGGSGVDLSKTIAPIETTSTASRAYAVGDYFIDEDGYNSRVTVAVALGGTLTLNTNYVRTTVTDEIKLHDVTVKTQLMGPYNATANTPFTITKAQAFPNDNTFYMFTGYCYYGPSSVTDWGMRMSGGASTLEVNPSVTSPSYYVAVKAFIKG